MATSSNSSVAVTDTLLVRDVDASGSDGHLSKKARRYRFGRQVPATEEPVLGRAG